MKKLLDNWQAKLVSLLLAIGLWGYTQYLRFKEIQISVPVSYVNKSSRLQFKNDPRRFIKVTVRGSEENIKFPTANLKAEVDLANGRAGSHSYQVSFNREQLPERVEVTEMVENVTIDLEKSVEKVVRVVPSLSGKVAAGFKRGRVVVKPEKVRVLGAQSKITSITSVETKEIDISGARSTITSTVSFNLPGRTLKVIDANDVSVTIPVFVIPKGAETVVLKTAVRLHSLDPALQGLLSEKKVQVQLQAEPDIIKQVTEQDVQAFVDVESTTYNPKNGNILPFETETFAIKARMIRFRNKVQVVGIIPENITVRFKVKKDFVKPEKKAETTPGPGGE